MHGFNYSRNSCKSSVCGGKFGLAGLYYSLCFGMYRGAESTHRYSKLTHVSDGNLVFSTTTDYVCSSLNSGLGSPGISMALVRTEGNMRYSYDYGYGLVLVPG
ncbi:hypothetical protein H4I96_03675 [Botrytis cinerea]